MIKIKRGLCLPISGSPQQTLDQAAMPRQVALLGPDYVDMKPSMAVAVGDSVRVGDPLFTDKKNPEVRFTSPACGKVAAIHRGHKRALQSVVIDIEGDEAVSFRSWKAEELATVPRQQVVDQLLESGLWTALKTRPFSKVPAPDSAPRSIFVTAMDTHPLAANPELVIAGQAEAFEQGLIILNSLTQGPVYLCTAPGAAIPAGPAQTQAFAGPHPAGLAGTHIHFLDPVGEQTVVWSIGYQDVIAIGKLFVTGQLWTERVIALAGPQVKKPRLLRTRLGVCLDDLVAGELCAGENRVISGSVLGGRTATGPLGFLGRWHNQVTVLQEGRDRDLLHYLSPGMQRYSAMPVYLSHLINRLYDFTTSTQGSERAMVPVGAYEKIMPLDILPTQLLRSLIVGDMTVAGQLGALELDEEDLALCTFVCPGKYDYGSILRSLLTRMEQEG